MENQFGVGLAGAGVIGQLHAQELAGVDTARLVAIAEPRQDAGKALAEKYGAKWYESFEEMLADPDVDVVILGTPSGLHPDQAIAAAQAGKHVITEKPMAISDDGASRMIQACDDAGVRLAVIFQNRLSNDVFKTKRAMDAGLLGKPILGNAYLHWFRSQDYYDANGGWRGTWALDGGGALINQTIHLVDALQWIMGGVASVQAHVATLSHDIETEDTAAVSLRFKSGALGTIQATTSATESFPIKLEIVGDKAKATLEANTITQWEGSDRPDDSLLTAEDHALVDGWQTGEPFGAAHRRQLRAIFQALADGTEAPFPGPEARKAVDIILAVYKSAQTGQRVDLDG